MLGRGPARTAARRQARSPPTVYVVEDDTEVRAALQYLLKSEGLGVRSFPSAESFLEVFDPEDAGCVLADLRLPGIGGLELLRTMGKHGWPTPVILLTAFADVPSAVGALESGAVAFLEKPFDPATLVRRVREALEADMRDRRARKERAAAEARLARLTKRQQQVLHLMVAGRATKEIAGELGIRYRTAEGHRRQVMKRMDVESMAELATLAVRFGLAGPPQCVDEAKAGIPPPAG